MNLQATRDIRRGENITPPIPPLSYVLDRDFLSTRCSSCFRELPSSIGTRLSGVKITHGDYLCSNVDCLVRYCSPECLAADLNIHLSSGDCTLLSMPCDDELLTDLRLSIRLMFLLKDSEEVTAHRVGGLLSDKHLIKNQTQREGLKLLLTAWERKNGPMENSRAEAIFCAVLTNQCAVPVPDQVSSVGAAVYPAGFSYLNHSCSPKASYIFHIFEDFLAEPHGDDLDRVTNAWNTQLSLHKGFNLRSPMVSVRCIHVIKAGEEIHISYINNLLPKARRSEILKDHYNFDCHCDRCDEQQHDKVQLEYEKGIKSLNDIHKLFERIGDRYDAKVYVNCLNVLIGRLLNPNCDLQVKSDPSLSLEDREYLSSRIIKLTQDVVVYPVNYDIRTLFSLYLQVATDLDDYKVEAAFRCVMAASLYQLFRSEPSIISHVATSWSLFGFSLEQVYDEIVQKGDEVKEVKVEMRSKNFVCARKCKMVNSFVSTDEDFWKNCDQIWACVREIISNVWPALSKGIECLEYIRDPTNFDFMAAPSEESISRYIHLTGIRGQADLTYSLMIHCFFFADLLGRLSMGSESPTVQGARKKLTANGH